MNYIKCLKYLITLFFDNVHISDIIPKYRIIDCGFEEQTVFSWILLKEKIMQNIKEIKLKNKLRKEILEDMVKMKTGKW